MQSIRHALTERQYTWEDAVDVAKNDPEIHSGKKGLAYNPSAYEEDVFDEDEGWTEVERDTPATLAETPPSNAATQPKTPEATR